MRRLVFAAREDLRLRGGAALESGEAATVAPAQLVGHAGAVLLRITRKALPALPDESNTGRSSGNSPAPELPGHPAYQQITTAFADSDEPLRARDLCLALDLTIVPKSTEEHRKHPLQAQAPGQPWNPHRERTRPVRPTPPVTPHRTPQAASLTRRQPCNGHRASWRPLSA
ncbi:hypothetical protein GCM10010211_16610 [Streptomyces albospinus]|uniref:Uncharacterized protein n=1 Tax=Streptomyces albospinus TaxID=285515 RepID=A0ABQ2UV69_9ACTN|nr:hypothetical protein [Streptomyces albospinus]GGU52776.1 hypothetical protein GCM10010211_16610 [Streptomyces albospinus]